MRGVSRRGGAGRTAVVGGGARSGKSAFALSLARRSGERRVFLATAQALDDEMSARIERHREVRGEGFRTVEEPLEVCAAVRGLEDADVLLVDCATLWIANLLLAGGAEAEILRRVDELVALLAAKPFPSIVVTNEVGMGIVPESPLGRAFRDLSGTANRCLARAAEEVYLACLGVVLRLRPAPIMVCDPAGAE